MKFTKIFSLVLAVIMALSMTAVFAACNDAAGGVDTSDTTAADVTTGAPTNATTGSEETTKAPDEPEVDHDLAVNVKVLNGTTGFGIAQLMDKNAKGEAALKYSFTVESDASLITASLLNGSTDIAALPTNAAANLYAKKAGEVQVLAVNTLGVLYVVTGEGVSVDSIDDLDGKTVYCPAQNPAFVMQYICKKNNVNVTIDSTTYAKPDALREMVVAGKVDIAVLPEPMVTIATSANKSLSVALDLTEEWDKVSAKNSLAQGCIVARTEFVEAHPAEVAAFLAEYEDSINYVVENPTEAGAMIEAQGVFAKGAVAAKAIPNCNLCFVTGAEMKNILTAFYTALNEVAPASIGGAIPGDGLYYGVGK